MAYFSICFGFQKGDFLPQVLTSFKQHSEQLCLLLEQDGGAGSSDDVGSEDRDRRGGRYPSVLDDEK